MTNTRTDYIFAVICGVWVGLLTVVSVAAGLAALTVIVFLLLTGLMNTVA